MYVSVVSIFLMDLRVFPPHPRAPLTRLNRPLKSNKFARKRTTMRGSGEEGLKVEAFRYAT